MRKLGILTCLIQWFVAIYKEDNNKEEGIHHQRKRDKMEGSIRYIKISGDYDNFYQRKDKTRAIASHKVTLNYLREKWYNHKE